jgi:hypothetical protein
MADVKIAYFHKPGNNKINKIYTNHLETNPFIIEEKIFHEDLNSALSYFEHTARGVPHIAHLFGSLYVRKTFNYGRNIYIANEYDNFSDPNLEHADVLILHADELVFLSDQDVTQLLNFPGKILIDATFEAFTYTYYYTVFKLFTEHFQPKKELYFVVGTDKYKGNSNFEHAFKTYTGFNLTFFNYFRINEVLVGSSGIEDHQHDYKYVKNFTSEEQIKENFYANKTKTFLCLNNRPRFHRMALVKKLRDLDLLHNNYVSARWQLPTEEHIVQPLIKELWFQHEHSPRMRNELAIYGETPPTLIEELKKYPHQLIIPEIDDDKDVILDDHTPSRLNDRSFNNNIYKNSYFSIAVETYYEDSFIDYYPEVLVKFPYTSFRTFLTEKVYKPIMYGHPFIPFAMKNTSTILEKQGFVNFHDEFNCDNTYDTADDNIRYKTFIDIISNVDTDRFNSATLDKVIYNYKSFYSKQNIMEHIDNFFNYLLSK